MRPLRPPSWDMAGSSPSRGCGRAIRKPFVKASAIWRRRGYCGWAHPKKRGGRRLRTVAQPTLEANLRDLLQECTAGDPMREGVLWTNLSLRELSRRLVALGTPASRRTIRRLLRKLNLGRRTARKKKTMGHHPDRNAQFENIARLRREDEASGDAVMSIDTKKKAWLGNFHRPDIHLHRRDGGHLCPRLWLRQPGDTESPRRLCPGEPARPHPPQHEPRYQRIMWRQWGLVVGGARVKRPIPRQNGCSCWVTVAAATARRTICLRKTSKGWRSGLGERFGWPMIRHTVPHTIRSNTQCSRTSRAPAKG